jgi:hypothetical protein
LFYEYAAGCYSYWIRLRFFQKYGVSKRLYAEIEKLPDTPKIEKAEKQHVIDDLKLSLIAPLKP